MRLWTLVFFMIWQLPVFGQAQLSHEAKISIITCGPDQDELYSAFGHSAIRVYDSPNGLDIVYNYGVFKFSPTFYLNFMRGELLYKLGVSRFDDFQAFYVSQNRYMHEQVLNLSAGQIQVVFDYLKNNARPENATYRYDYFYNNCATKVRDVFVDLFAKHIKFDESYTTSGYTIRTLTGDRLRKQRWGKLAIDICLGLPMDKKLTLFEYMYLPDYLESGFDYATIDGKPLVKDKVLIYVARKTTPPLNLFQPWLVFVIVLLLTVLVSNRDLKRNRRTKWLDLILFPVTGAIGMVLLFLWIATDHKAAANNLNLLWAVPLHIFVPVFLSYKKFQFLLKPYFLGTLILLIIQFPLWVVMSKPLNNDLTAILLILYFRTLTLYRLNKQTRLA